MYYTYHLVSQPKYSIQLDRLHHTKKFYYFEIGFVLTIGTVPYIVLASFSEFQIGDFPPQFCVLTPAGNFYGIVLPTLIVNCTTVIILLLILYHVHVVSDVCTIIIVVGM